MLFSYLSVMFFYFKIISILLPQALPVCTLPIIWHLHHGFGFCFFLFCFHPKFWAGSLGGMFLNCVRHQDLPFTLKHQDLFFSFCHPTFLCRSTWYAPVHRLPRRLWPGTNLQSVFWFWSHKHDMLGAQSCSVLQASLCVLNGRCNLIQPTALAINTELRCALSMAVSHCSLQENPKQF